MYDSESGHISNIVTHFLERTDSVVIESDYIEDRSDSYLREAHPCMQREIQIFHLSKVPEFASMCGSCTEIRYLCTEGADSDIYYEFIKLASRNGSQPSELEPSLYNAAFEPFNFLVPSMVPEDVMGIVGLAIHYDADFNTYMHPDILTADDSVEHILSRATSVVRRHSETKGNRVLKIRVEGIWQDYDPGKTYVYRADRLIL